MRRLTILLAFAVLESWPASIIVGPGRTYQTVKSAILGSLPLDDNLNIYVEMPTGTYTVQETITPDASWNGKSVKVTGLKWVPDITGYMGSDVVLEWNGDEVLPTTYNYLGLGGSVEGSVTPSGSRRSYFKDHLGSTRMTVGDAGQILEASIFSAYGKEYWVVQTSGEQTREKFTGKEFDTEGTNGAELGVHLNYFGARYYDPDIGTWISPDPMRQFHSPYSYSGNGTNPINAVDPDGNMLDAFENGKWVGEVDPSSVSWGREIDNTDYQGYGELDKMSINGKEGHPLAGVQFWPEKNPFIAGGIGALDLIDNVGKIPKPSLSEVKSALRKVHEIIGGSLPKGAPGKWGSPQRGTSKLGYRLDPGHPGKPLGDPEHGWHINFWDWTKGKKGSGGEYGAIPIRE